MCAAAPVAGIPNLKSPPSLSWLTVSAEGVIFSCTARHCIGGFASLAVNVSLNAYCSPPIASESPRPELRSRTRRGGGDLLVRGGVVAHGAPQHALLALRLQLQDLRGGGSSGPPITAAPLQCSRHHMPSHERTVPARGGQASRVTRIWGRLLRASPGLAHNTRFLSRASPEPSVLPLPHHPPFSRATGYVCLAKFLLRASSLSVCVCGRGGGGMVGSTLCRFCSARLTGWKVSSVGPLLRERLRPSVTCAARASGAA